MRTRIRSEGGHQEVTRRLPRGQRWVSLHPIRPKITNTGTEAQQSHSPIQTDANHRGHLSPIVDVLMETNTNTQYWFDFTLTDKLP